MNRNGQVTRKVAHHQVCCPGCLQIGKAVENIEGVFSFPFNDVVYIHGKGFKAVGQRQTDRFDLGAVGNQGVMACKTEIDDIPPVADCLFHIGFHKQPELGQVRHPPDDIVPQPDIVKRRIHFRNA